jgi:soluble lytic murein transglycosylase-like protein
MQVMPFHAGAWGCESEDLTDPETNVCHGTRILAHALRRLDGDLERALLRYNGCVRGTNTPDCHSYPSRVLAHAASWAASAGSRQVVASVRAR